jgi:uncharacterized protein YecE (DUF72 family)
MPRAPASAELFAPTANAMRIRAGIGGWTYAPWRGAFYPEKWPQKRELEFAARQLPTIEVNGTFYGAQKPATYAKWRSETPEGFVFSLKAPRYCTDRRVLAEAGKTVGDFVHGGLAELGDRLGPILWQFEPRHAFEPDDFARFLDLLPTELGGYPLRHVLEVRSPTFLCREFLALARRHRFPCVFTDSPDYPSFADLTGDFVYARLMRSAMPIDTGYPAEALSAWAERARCWAMGEEPADLPRIETPEASTAPRERKTARDVFVYFIGAAKARNPAAAMALMERLQDRTAAR